MPDIKQVLQQAAAEGSSVTMVYNGGSRPGQSRVVIPISISHGELVAREPTTRLAKHFKLEKIAAVALTAGEAVQNTEVVAAAQRLVPDFASFEEYAAFFRSSLAETGWQLEERGRYFGVCGFFKNGKPRKTPAASIQYVDRSEGEAVFDFETGELSVVQHEITGRERPWRVDSKRFREGKAFGLLPKAAELFFQEVQALGGPGDA